MKLSIVGCPDKERFRPYVKRAVLFYAKELMSDKMLENITIKIKFDAKIEHYGYASVSENNDHGKARSFLIEMNPLIGARAILKAIGHEMVHIKQFATGETNDSLTRWKGTTVAEDLDYWIQPWEIEAYGREAGLFQKFVRQEKLWEVFKTISNPDDPIVPESLGWKEHE